ncbi:glycosyltransferase [Devosia sp. A449]
MNDPNPGSLPVVFLGGIFTPAQTNYVLEQSKGNIQNAADAFQKNIIRGLTENSGVDVSLVNLPFIGTYPYLFSKPKFPGTHEEVFGDVKVVGMPFVLGRPWKTFSRFLAAAKGLKQLDTQRGSVILIYSAHLPFLAAALWQKLRKRDTRACLVLPDLPEFMDERGILYAMVKAVESRLFRLLAKRLDGFVVLTRAMAGQLRLDDSKFVVVEGIAAPSDLPEIEQSDTGKRVFLYTGTLASRYGIADLIESFQKVKGDNAELWIAGEGDAREHIIVAAQQDTRIKFFGQVSRPEALRLQMEATVLVNPRKPTGEFTKYSFPSKTMEYMASGRPVVMFRLPGMPEEYIPHFIDPGMGGANAMQRAIEKLVNTDLGELKAFGANARQFVLTQKNAKAQGYKILALMSSVSSRQEVYRPSPT